MRRRHTPAETNLLARRRKVWLRFGLGPWPVSRKRHPLDCGHTRCVICHSDKIHGHEPTRQEVRAASGLTPE